MSLKTEDVRAAMRKQWAAPEYAIMWEVAPATGASHSRQRYADAMIMSLWPSRGLHLHGVEIKVHRADWLREAKDPTKAERLAAYCDFWWIHVVPGVIFDLAEVPMMWGVREFDGKRWKTLREAKKTDAQPCDRSFLASLLRRGDEQVGVAAAAMVENVLKAERAQIAVAIERGIKAHTERQGQALEAVQAFKEASGIDLLERGYTGPSPREAGALVRAIHMLGLGKTYGGVAGLMSEVKNLTRRLDQIGQEVETAIGEHVPALQGFMIEHQEAETARIRADTESRKRGR